jgi:UDP-N-acetylglucosamine 4,6-dehydratase
MRSLREPGGAVRLLAALRGLPRTAKISIALAYDFVACVAVGIAVDLLCSVHGVSGSSVFAASLAAAATSLACITLLGGYAAVVRFMGGNNAFGFAVALLAGTFVWLLLLRETGRVMSPAGILYWTGAFVLVFGSRFALGRANRRLDGGPGDRIPVVIYGAGVSGRQLAASLNLEAHYRAIAFVDDDATLHGLWVSGLKVHGPGQLPRLIAAHGVKEVFLALPSASRDRRREILRALSEHLVRVQTIPGLAELLSGKARLDELRPVMIEDVLGREPVAPHPALLRRNVEGKVVMVTGAGGSIGSELCRSIATLCPRALVLLDMSEHALFRAEKELQALAAKEGAEIALHAVMGSVESTTLCRRVFADYGVETVFHAAAYKHVPLVEMNVIEGVRNNVVGTKMLIDAIPGSSVSTFVMISTDKAVRPTSVMGASKRVAELLVQAAAAQSDRCMMSIVRFGNVLGSSGSVLPLFREQIASGGPITLTHPEVTRYFMTIPEAAQLVIQAGALGEHGDVFHLDMGEPIRILDLARRLLRLHGLRERVDGGEGDIGIRIVGLRPGEKLYEELLIDSDARATPHPRIFRARERFLPAEELMPLIVRLITACHLRDEAGVVSMLGRLVEGYAGTSPAPPEAAGAPLSPAGTEPTKVPAVLKPLPAAAPQPRPAAFGHG